MSIYGVIFVFHFFPFQQVQLKILMDDNCESLLASVAWNFVDNLLSNFLDLFYFY